MRRRLAVPLAVLALLAAGAGVASARLTEIGASASPAAPSCPVRPCYAVSRTTGFQVQEAGRRGVYGAPRAGKVVAWTITLGRPSASQRRFFERNLGGRARAGISILKPGERLFFRSVAQSKVEGLSSYFGKTVQFVLDRPLPVRKGEIIALTVPTWAPALSVGVTKDNSWRASRAAGACENNETQSAQLDVRDLAQYRCLYRTARVTYSATFISTP